jgi:5-methylcytosine-specific restriction endonuclease McrA
MTRDRWTCQECGAPATQVDHVVPVIDGGTDDPANLRALCREHNLARRTDL